MKFPQPVTPACSPLKLVPAGFRRGACGDKLWPGSRTSKKLDFTPDLIRGCWNDEGGISCFVVTRRSCPLASFERCTVSERIDDSVGPLFQFRDHLDQCFKGGKDFLRLLLVGNV